MPAVNEAITARFGVDLTQFNRGMKTAKTRVKTDSKAMTTSFGTVAKSFGGIAVAMGALSVANAVGARLVSFQTRLAEVSTIIDTTTVDMGEMRQALIDISKEVPQTPSDLGAGLYQVFSSGVTDASEALQVLKTSAKAATGGLTSTFKVVDATTTVLNAYGLASSEAMRINDVFFETVKQGKINFDELASTIGDVATVGSLAGIPIEEIGAAVATMTKAGINASETMTSLNRIILSLVDSTPEAVNAARQLGIDWSVAGVEARGFSGILGDLEAATKGDIEALNEIVPDIRSFRAAAILAGTGAKEFTKILEAMGEVTGNVEQASEKMTQTFSAQWDILTNQLTGAMDHYAAPVLEGVTKAIANLTKEADKSLEPQGWYAKTVAAAGTVAQSMGMMTLAINLYNESLKSSAEERAKALQTGSAGPSGGGLAPLGAMSEKLLKGMKETKTTTAVVVSDTDKMRYNLKVIDNLGITTQGHFDGWLGTIRQTRWEQKKIGESISHVSRQTAETATNFSQIYQSAEGTNRAMMGMVNALSSMIAMTSRKDYGMWKFFKDIFSIGATAAVAMIPGAGPYLAPLAATSINRFTGSTSAGYGVGIGGSLAEQKRQASFRPERDIQVPIGPIEKPGGTHIENLYLGDSLIPPTSPDGAALRKIITNVVHDEKRKGRF